MKKPVIFFLFISLIISFSSCEEEIEHPEPLPVNSLIAKAGDDQQSTVGMLVTLDGSASEDTENKPFQFSWTFKSKPENSAAVLSASTSVKPGFTPDKLGLYVVELKIHNADFDAKDEVSIMAIAPEPVPELVILSQDISQERHLTNIFADPTVPDYLVTADIHVKGFLTIDPNVVIAFEEGVAMYIDNPGAIRATGWGGNPIIFTGKDKTRGFWKGLIINSQHSLNLLEHVTIEYGGSSPADGMEVATNLGVDNSGFGKIALRNSIIQFSAGYGIVVENGGNLTNHMFNNIYKGNDIPLRLSAAQIPFIDGFSTFFDNDKNLIEVDGTTVYSNTEEIKWGSAYTNSYPPASIPYLVKGKIEVASGLRIFAGAEFQFEADGEILVTQNGYLAANGSQDRPIKFYGKQQVKGGYWKGIGFKTSSTLNQLKNVVVDGAGSNLMYGFAHKTAVGVDENGKLRLSDTKIGRSGKYGLFVEENAELAELNFMSFEDNEGSAIGMAPKHMSILFEPVLEFTGNGHNGIEFYESVLNTGNEESIWPALHFGASYFVNGNMDIRSGLKILPGAEVKFAEGKLLKVTGNGYLNALGLEHYKIRFRGMAETKGYWMGILFQTNSNLNFLNHTEVLHAGKTEMPGIAKITSIGIDGDYYAKAIVANSKIAHGNGYGIVVESDRASINSDVETVNQFEDLLLGNVSK